MHLFSNAILFQISRFFTIAWCSSSNRLSETICQTHSRNNKRQKRMAVYGGSVVFKPITLYNAHSRCNLKLYSNSSSDAHINIYMQRRIFRIRYAIFPGLFFGWLLHIFIYFFCCCVIWIECLCVRKREWNWASERRKKSAKWQPIKGNAQM